MDYPPQLKASLSRVETTREKRLSQDFPVMSPQEKEKLIREFHPDYRPTAMRQIRVGPNKGEKMPVELCDLLEAHSRLDLGLVDLGREDEVVDVLVVGGGGAGAAAALLAREEGADVLLVTKLRLGDANTMLAEGGIQAADGTNDSLARHYLDMMGGGDFTNIPELASVLVRNGPHIIRWLEKLGVMFDKDYDGNMLCKHGGGTSRRRVHSARDLIGAEIMRTLRDEICNRRLRVREFTAALELVLDQSGRCAGAVLLDMDTMELRVVRAGAVVLATGGSGRLHYQGFPTTNHYGATGDGVVMAYHAGARLVFMDSVQYHPTGVVFPEQMAGQLVSEKARSLGAQIVNSEGEQFAGPLETRDVVTSAIIRECERRGKGVHLPAGSKGVWLDLPMVEILKGTGTLKQELPALCKQYERQGINVTKEAVLVYPTLHYQNGGVLIDEQAETSISGLFVAGEAAGGIHGRNRLMGNSLLDILVFGRRAGLWAAHRSREAKPGRLSLDHLHEYHRQLAEAGITKSSQLAPKLLPDYVRQEGPVLSVR
ncbi:MAG: FAD-binding protein [Syntrophothermus sp.]